MEPIDLLRRLADGNPHSGERLARAFGVSRAAVWKQMTKLKEWDIEVHAVRGSGYRLGRPLDLLDADALLARSEEHCVAPIERIQVFTALESTNRRLLDSAAPRPGALSACLAEYQTAGRGRHGRCWNTPFGAGLCLSVAWQFVETPPDLAALTLACGVAIRRALSRAAGVDVALKWPNDLVWDDRKLGGILVELSGEAHGGCRVVIGVGLNVSMPPELLASVCDWTRGAVDLAEASGLQVSRTVLAADAIAALGDLLAGYSRSGFAPYHREWLAADYLGGKPIRFGPGTLGIARGIDADGALRVETPEGVLKRVISGDVSVRPAA